jgi:hypothetical protein
LLTTTYETTPYIFHYNPHRRRLLRLVRLKARNNVDHEHSERGKSAISYSEEVDQEVDQEEDRSVAVAVRVSFAVRVGFAIGIAVTHQPM